MSDQRVVALFYDIEHRPSVVYREEEPRDYEEENFSVRIENKEVRFTMKAPYATKEEAKEAVREYIDNWEFTAGLRGGPSVFKLVYRNAEIEHQKPLDPVFWKITTTKPTGTLTKSYPPPPQSGLKITPKVQSMYDRFMGYRLGREFLPGVAYFCLTVLEGATEAPKRDRKRRKAAAKQYGIELAVLDKIGTLSSEKGDSQARKADGIGSPLTPSDTRFLEKAIVTLIRRAAEVAHDREHDPHKSRDEVELLDFCPPG